MTKILLLLVLFSQTLLAHTSLSIQPIANNVYALVGETGQRSAQNLGNNSTHGVIVTQDGVILIDAGASYLGAQEIHQTIRTITNQPIKIVINTGGQDHRWLGNDYFQKLGAKIIASSAAKADQQARSEQQMARLTGFLGDKLAGTQPVFATETFNKTKIIKLGGVKLELYYFGSAHTAGDIVIWMPSAQIMFAGDVIFNDRMLGVGAARNIQSWITVFEKMAAFQPKYLVPGHGRASNLQTATQNTYDYLVFLREKIGEILDNDGDMLEASKIDQSQFYYLKNHASISGKNAQWVFEQMEFDD